jgi:hypothetical protein
MKRFTSVVVAVLLFVCTFISVNAPALAAYMECNISNTDFLLSSSYKDSCTLNTKEANSEENPPPKLILSLIYPEAIKQANQDNINPSVTDTKDYSYNQGNLVLFGGGSADLLVAKDPKEQDSLLSALRYAAEKFATIATNAKRIHDFRGGLNGSIDRRHPTQMEHFIYQIKIPIKSKSKSKILTLRYQYANNSPGYIIYQELKDMGTNTSEGGAEITNLANDSRVKGYAKNYSSTHESTGKSLWKDLLEQDPKATEAENSKKLDARTKIAGEGARFRFIRDNIETISDDSRVYLRNGSNVLFVKMSELWQHWRSVFQSNYGIENQTIAKAFINSKSWSVGLPYTVKKENFKPTVNDISLN